MEPEKKSHGALIGSIIIIIILLVGGIYIWQSKVKQTVNAPTTAETTSTASDINDLNSLDQDLNNIDTNTNVDIDNLQ